jgi:hypothetical protein
VWRLLRISRRRQDPTAERNFEETLGISQLPDGLTHPVHDADARTELARQLARDVSDNLWQRVDQARAAGSWTPEMQAALDDLAELDPNDPASGGRLASFMDLLPG